MSMMTYKGYDAVVTYDDDAGVFHGEVINTRDVITFQGVEVSELKKALAESIEDYLTFCRERGEEPEKPFSGQFIVRVAPETHRAAASAARRSGVSLNKYIATLMERATA
jgi:predicted HicB family RNase H-like nuclease